MDCCAIYSLPFAKVIFDFIKYFIRIFLNITFQNIFQIKFKSTLFRFRFILNIHELVVIGNAIKCMEQGQNGFPIWSLYMISISHLMLSLNSSTNIFIYFFLSSRFRQDCKRRYSRMKNTIRHE